MFNNRPAISFDVSFRFSFFRIDKAFSKCSRKYTTRKDEFEKLEVLESGIIGDYNHYRTTALGNTTDRAVSILTSDVIEILKDEKSPWSQIQSGDLGENLFVDGLFYYDFQVGKKIGIYDPKTRRDDESCVILEITEPIVPCANLCKLPFINNSTTDPKDRIKSCKHFIERLAQDDGLRGWYAKVLQSGAIEKGDTIELL